MESLPQKDVCTNSVFKELSFAHARHLHNFLFYKGAPAEEAVDLVQEAFLRMWRECSKVPFEKTKAFLFTVASNLFLDAKKHEKAVRACWGFGCSNRL